jgi:DNA-binding LacI/PurR family transcriptional regulator
MANNKSPTMKDVAEQAQVSVATVSRVINNEPSVSEINRRAVLAAIEDLHYELRSSAQRNQGLRIGLVIPDITNPYFPLLIKGITALARVHDAEVILCNANGAFEAEKNHFCHLAERGVDGIIYIPFLESVNPLVKDLVDSGFPIVFLDREVSLDNICSVTSNNEEGAYQAVTYLLNLGHRDILFISGPSHFSTSISRLAGYRHGLQEHGVPFREEMVIYGDTTQEGAHRLMQEFLARSGLPFTAVFASNDLMAFGATQALEEKGYRVPDDVSMVGYDDIPCSAMISLTTIAQPSFEIGSTALILLVDLINKRRQPPHRIVLRDSLIIRRSCRRI